jgi:DNA-binding transcriptional LysR family regulator
VYPGIELRLLRYVVAVAQELQHFSRAALRVHVSQPSLSKQIRDSEESIGVRLFDRTNRHVELTKAGRAFVKEAKEALAHSERAVHHDSIP